MIGVAAGMQNLQRNLPTLSMHCPGNFPMLRCFAGGCEFAGKGFHPAGPVGCVAACNDQADPAPRSKGHISSQTIMLIAVFEPGVHGAHKHPVFQCRKTEIKRCEQVRILCASQRLSFIASMRCE